MITLNYAGYLPEIVAITEGSSHDVNPKDGIIAMDWAITIKIGIKS